MTEAKEKGRRLPQHGENEKLTDCLLLGGLIVLFVLFSLTTNGRFIKLSNLKALLLQSSLYIIAACGVLFVNENIRLIPSGRTVTFAMSWMNLTACRHTRLFIDFVMQKEDEHRD